MKKYIKKSAVLFVIAVLLIGLSIPAVNHSHNKALAISEPVYYNRINFNVKSKTGTMPLSYVKDFLVFNNIVPLRVWILIDNDITAMFTYQKDWNLKTFDRNIRKDIMKNYALRLKYDSDSLKKNLNNRKLYASYEKLVKQDERILKNISNPSCEIKVLAVDTKMPNLTKKSLISVPFIKEASFNICQIPYSEIIPSPQMQRGTEISGKSITSSSAYLKDPPPPPDSEWLPNYVATDVRTLRDSQQTRYINQQAEWYSNNRMTYYHTYTYSAYEQDTVFWREDNNTRCYVLYTDPPDTSMVLQWYSNFPDPYLDSRYKDTTDHITLTIGCSTAGNMDAGTQYYYTMYVKKGNVNSGHELETDEQPCYYRYPFFSARLGIFPLETHIDCFKSLIPNFYTWIH